VETLCFRDYGLENVYRSASPEQRTEAVAFWLAQSALASRREGERRAGELVYLVRRADGALAGMSTAALTAGPDGRPYFAFRMFLRREDRVPYLMRTVTHATRDFLRALDHPAPRPAGMLIVTENRKLMRPGIRRYFERHGCVFRGRTPRGLDVWLAPFDETAASAPSEKSAV
jgi:hypothetical protein